MPIIQYKNVRFKDGSLDVINYANAIIMEYAKEGYDLTLRQLYYQFVARDLIANSDKEYKRLGSIINDARLSGYIDWDAITDRTRPIRINSHWDNPQAIIESCSEQFRIDTRYDQPFYIEVWVEKDALVGVLEGICTKLDVPYFSCRGYVSQSSMWEASQRFIHQEKEFGKTTVLLHLGDHDPSGVDMSRDIQSRLELFESQCAVKRIALTMKQIKQYSPPPNPAKLTDSRCNGYIYKYGRESWELDALEPRIITQLITKEVGELTETSQWENMLQQQSKHRNELKRVSARWNKVQKVINKP